MELRKRQSTKLVKSLEIKKPSCMFMVETVGLESAIPMETIRIRRKARV